MNSYTSKKGMLLLPLYLFFAFFLVFATTNNAYAESAEDEARSTIQSIVDAPIKITGDDKDYAQVWFKDIFGEFIFAPWADEYKNKEPTLISHAIGFTNILAMILGVVIVYYVIIGGALNTAQQGEVLGKEWSSVWLPIRTATGFSLIMPMQTIGGGVLSFAQVFILWLIMLGSNAATLLWEQSIDKITSSSGSTEPTISIGYTPSHKMFKMLMCTENYIKNRTMGQYSWTTSLQGTNEIINMSKGFLFNVTRSTNAVGREVEFTDENTSVYAENKDDSVDAFRLINSGVSFSQQFNQFKPSVVEFAGGSCGIIEFGEGEDNNIASDYKVRAMNESRDELRKITGEHLDELLAIVKTMYTTPDSEGNLFESTRINADRNAAADGLDGKTLYLDATKAFRLSASAYSGSLVPAVHQKLSGGDEIKKKFLLDIKSGGWGKAGIWFFEIGALPGLTYQVINNYVNSIEISTPVLCVASTFSGYENEDCKAKQKDLMQSMLLADSFLAQSVKKSTGIGSGGVSVTDKVTSDCSGGEACSLDSSTVNRMATEWSKGVLNHLSSNNGVGDTTTLSSPFETVSSIGHSLNNYAASAWAIGALFNGFMEGLQSAKEGVWGKAAGFFTGEATSFGAGFLIGMGKWLLMSIIALATAMLSTGFVLAYLIPFLPIVTWIMMITGYLVTVVEAVIASPLAIILMVTPEGEGIAGTRLERALQLLAMSILKPSLMIMALITAISISGVSFAILNEFIFEAAEHVLHGGIFDFVAMMIIYTMTALQLSKLLIGVMHRLPDQILEWFSAGMGRSFGENEIGQTLESGSSEMKGTMGSMNKDLIGGISNTLRDRKKAKLYGGGQ